MNADGRAGRRASHRTVSAVAALCACLALLVPCAGGCAAGGGVSGEAAAAAGTLVYEETASPNKAYVTSEDDVVYCTVRVFQADDGQVTVVAESNFPLFDSVSYTVEYDGTLTEDDVSVRWTTMMGSTQPSEDDELAVAHISLTAEDGTVVDGGSVNFAGKAFETALGAIG